MSVIGNIGRRVELVSMDRHFHDISIGLYQQHQDSGPEFLVKTYSTVGGAQKRTDSVLRAMEILGGMKMVAGENCLRHTCQNTHAAATKRLFLEACKVSPTENISVRSLSIFDKKSDGDVVAVSMSAGRYHLNVEPDTEKARTRRGAITAGLVKLAELEWINEESGEVVFSCGHSHDELIGLLLPRALNVRSFLRQQQMEADRGRLLAPSAQQE